MKTDIELQKKVLDELHSDPFLGASSAEIGVVAKDGTVTLFGQLSSHAKILAAERAAKRVKGVKIVAMEIIVVVPGKASRTTTCIARAVCQALNWHMALEDAIIKVKVEDEWVYLEGEVSSHFQKALAENALKKVAGIKGIINLITINQHIDNELQKLETSMTAEAYKMDTNIATASSKAEGDKRVFFSEKEGLRPEGVKALKYIWKGPGCKIVKKKNINGVRVGFPGAQNAGRLKK